MLQDYKLMDYMKIKLLLLLSILSVCCCNLLSQDLIQDTAKNDSLNHKSTTEDNSLNKEDANNLSLFEKGIIAYNQGDFYQAIDYFQKEINAKAEENLEAPELYYNLGNAYYRTQNLGYARLYYEKALLLDPNNEKAKQNIKFLQTKLENKTADIDIFFISVWFRYFQQLHSSNTWNNLGIATFLIFLGTIAIFVFTKKILIKKTVFYIGLISLILCLFANVFAYKQAEELTIRTHAVILSPTANIYSSPDTQQKELFTLYEGSKVKITKDDKNWLEIESSDGNIGWIQSDKLAII